MKEPQPFRTLTLKYLIFKKPKQYLCSNVYCLLCLSSNNFSYNYRSQTTHITMMSNVELQDKNNFLYELNTYVQIVNSFFENLIQVLAIYP